MASVAAALAAAAPAPATTAAAAPPAAGVADPDSVLETPTDAAPGANDSGGELAVVPPDAAETAKKGRSEEAIKKMAESRRTNRLKEESDRRRFRELAERGIHKSSKDRRVESHKLWIAMTSLRAACDDAQWQRITRMIHEEGAKEARRLAREPFPAPGGTTNGSPDTMAVALDVLGCGDSMDAFQRSQLGEMRTPRPAAAAAHDAPEDMTPPPAPRRAPSMAYAEVGEPPADGPIPPHRQNASLGRSMYDAGY